MKTPINPWNVFAYVVGPAAAIGFAASAIPAVLGDTHVTTAAGLVGAGAGAVVGAVVGLIRRFQ